MNLPNFLTILRIFMVPLFAYLILNQRMSWALSVFAVASITDGLDGYIARVYDLKTRLGSFLDPLADKLLLLTSYILLGILGHLPIWLTYVVVARDMVILSGIIYLYLTNKQLEFSPTILGKITTFVQLFTILLLLFSDLYPGILYVLPSLYLINLFVTLVSGIHYFFVGFRMSNTGTISVKGEGLKKRFDDHAH
jgi:cardiolipin synthase